MGNHIKSELKKVLGEDLLEFCEAALELAPYVGDFLQSRKLNRLVSRLQEHQDKLKYIQKTAGESKNIELIQEKIGPIVFSDLIEEHEDAKVIYLLNGYEHSFINDSPNESLFINYFDTLRNLRYEDVRMLFYIAGLGDNPFKEYAQESAEYAMSRQIYSKLERAYLIKSASSIAYLENGPEVDESILRPVLSNYGIHFLEFVIEDFDRQKYAEQQKADHLAGEISVRFGAIEEEMKKPVTATAILG
ncbi:hypothetical protein M3557_12040 [Bhargavaea ginsengi]|uniref:hypothetical protein n=1 Tax=Bhargavaea ginsengi TaxID=426757 RepID=UPI0020424E5C|nr:hypothetical protein [Bhargavaea ginsengi]MCM3088652.1 hypothetical protein [Bhargavaea ginsengi]